MNETKPARVTATPLLMAYHALTGAATVLLDWANSLVAAVVRRWMLSLTGSGTAMIRMAGVSRVAVHVALICMAFLVAGCGTLQHDPISGRQVRNMYSLDQETQLGRSVVRSAVEEYEQQGVAINQDLAKLQTLSNMMHRIAAVSHIPDLPFSVTLIHSDTVNAACAPGGQLLFWEGLYDPERGLAQTENELAAVMAHEIAHATARHTTRTLTREAPIQMGLLLGMLAAELADKDDLAIGLGVAFVVYQGVWLPRYSRRDEFEADQLGLFYMADAGYDPRAASAIWQRAWQRQGDPGLERFLASHPSHRDRHHQLERLMPQALERYYAAVNQSSPLAARPNALPSSASPAEPNAVQAPATVGRHGRALQR